MKRVLLLCMTIVLVFSAFGCAEKPKTLAITGTGLVKAKPDLAVIRFGVEVSMPTASQAQNKATATIQKVMASLQKLGIKDENIMTANYNIWAEMKYPQNAAPKVTGYHCSNQIQVTIDDLKKVSKVMDSSIAAGVNNVQSITFSLKDDSSLKKQALEKAVKEASSKAAAVAKASGTSLSGVKKIVESSAVINPFNPPMYAMGGAGGADSSSVSTGLIEVKANITVIYGLK